MKKVKRAKSETEIYNDILLWKSKCLDEPDFINFRGEIALYYTHIFTPSQETLSRNNG
jgi:hypothetical protein